MRRSIVAATVGLLSSSALAQQTSQGTASTPDLSGMWAHVSCCGFEPPVTGPGPVTNRARRNGAVDLYQFVGDYTNPILKPEAAQVVKEHGDIELTGVPAALPSNQFGPAGSRSYFGTSASRSSSSPTRSPFSIPTIAISGKYA